jgi:hypothetical protein
MSDPGLGSESGGSLDHGQIPYPEDEEDEDDEDDEDEDGR